MGESAREEWTIPSGPSPQGGADAAAAGDQQDTADDLPMKLAASWERLMSGFSQLLGKLKSSNLGAYTLTVEHLLLEDAAAQDLQESVRESVSNATGIMSLCEDLLGRLAGVEDLSKQVKSLRKEVDKLVDGLKQSATESTAASSKTRHP
ncbi:unnamed protein product [Ostreobium quekettii]|uniref:BLOC-1-related complex subunit 6 C-terminal helix domain-containing protein n=1 Tax=Ostreobium quekettii TaxID=121088 RepID=A0A8S1IX00_9CHLO|nr:unnamed protein product [Ostreobium quekettii]|eukprot:evm.model.scf_204.4 EVM.evm.TU.scf_204.4   scf_204:20366-21318(-)